MQQKGFLNIGLGIIITVLAILGTSTYFLISKQASQTFPTPTAIPVASPTITVSRPSPSPSLSASDGHKNF